MVTFPRAHRCFRWFYDRIGPILAACLGSRWLADAAFCSLKLIEWPAGILLRILGIKADKIQGLYLNSKSG